VHGILGFCKSTQEGCCKDGNYLAKVRHLFLIYLIVKIKKTALPDTDKAVVFIIGEN